LFADHAGLMIAMGKHSTEERVVSLAQERDLEAGANSFVRFTLVAIKKQLGEWSHAPGAA
jgi:hypothetical protein